MSIFSDAKADQFVYDENYDYVNNKDSKTIVEPITPVKVHETFEVSTGNIYGPFNALFHKLMNSIKAQTQKDECDETKYNEDTYKAFFDEFTTKSLEILSNNMDVFVCGGKTPQIPPSL